MPLAYLLSPILAPGVNGRPVQRAAADDWAVAGAGRRCQAMIPTDPTTGLARFTWSLVQAEATLTDLVTLEQDTRVARLALALELDDRLDDVLNATLVTRIETALLKFGLVRDLTDLTARQVVRRLMRRLEPSLALTIAVKG